MRYALVGLFISIALLGACERTPVPPAKRAGVPRVVVLGDDVSAGESWVRVVEREAKGVEVMNLARAGAAPADYLRELEGACPALAPDVVVVGLHLGDDVLPGAPAEDVLLVRESAGVPAALARLVREVDAMQARCSSLPARCLFVLLPFALELAPGGAPWMAQPTPLAAQLGGALRARGLLVVDAVAALKGAPDRAGLLAADGMRLGERGHAVIGEAVRSALVESGALVRVGRETPRDARLDALLEGTPLEDASDDEQRLALKIAALVKLREEMQAVLKALPAEQAAAERMQGELAELERSLDAADVRHALEQAEAELKARQADEGSLLARAKDLDEKMRVLAVSEAPLESDTATVRALKQELARQQQATATLATGTAVAFRALRTLEQMKLALPALRERARGKR